MLMLVLVWVSMSALVCNGRRLLRVCHGSSVGFALQVFRSMEDAMADVSFAQIFAGC